MRKSRFLSATVLSAGLVIASPVMAQDSSGKDNKTDNAQRAKVTKASTTPVNEIIVTATKRSEPVQKVPSTVNVVSAESIQALHVQNTQELGQIVGGLSMTQTSPSEQSISLRGIKEPSGGGPSTYTVETYLNEVPITVFDAFASTLDLAQVEVLKGPQGTLRGRPSPSGAVLFTTQKGSFTDYSGYASATLSNHKGTRIEGAVGGPLSNTMAFRFAGVYDYNGLTGVKDIYNGKSNYREIGVGRATLSWQPSDKFEADLMGQYTRQSGDFYRQITGTAPCSVADGGTFPVSSIACGQTFTLFDKIALTEGANPNSYRGGLVTLNATYHLSDRLDVVYVGGFNKTRYYTNLNFDFAGVGEANNFGQYIDVDRHERTITNELRLQSNGDGFYNFIYGVYYENQRLDTVANLPPLFTGNQGKTTTTNLGLFTTQRFSFTSRDQLEVGVRYSSVDIKNRLTNTTRNYNAFTGTASFRHEFTPNIMAYVSGGTSYRPGSAGANAAPRPVIPASFGNFGPEKSRSIELGLKSRVFDDRLTLNIALFDQKYTGYINSQFNVACTGVPNPNGLAYATDDGTPNGPTCFGTMTSNGDVTSRGVEVEVQARPTDNWNIGGIFTYTDAHFSNALLPCNDYNGDGILDVNGTPMVQQGKYVSECKENGPLGSLPKVSFTANTSYNFDAGQFPAYIRLNSYTVSSSFFPQTGRTFPGYTTVNGSIGFFTPDHNWELSIWGKNLLNKVVEDTDGGPWSIFGRQSGLRIGTVTNDRELGVTLRRSF